MKQYTKKPHTGKRLLAATMATLLTLSLSGCFFFGPKEKRTEWIVDGEYKPFLSAEQTVEKLMEYIKAGDADSIYEIFSPTAKEASSNLQEKIEELIEFVNGEMVSWEYDTGDPFETYQKDGKITRNRIIEFSIQTERTEYACSFLDVMQDDFEPNNEGFCSITLVPKEATWLCRYGYFEGAGLGVFLSYPYQEDQQETIILESLLDLVINKDSDGIYGLFSEYAKENTLDLPEQVQSLIDFFNKPIRSWEIDDCVTEWVQLPGADSNLLRRMSVFSLHTDEETYTLQIRDLLDGSDEEESIGIYSIAISTEQYAGTNRELGWLAPGIFIYQLTMEPSTTQVKGGGIVRFTTSIEATITCNMDDVALRQIDALTWESTIPPEDHPYEFTATAGEEKVFCHIRYEKET